MSKCSECRMLVDEQCSAYTKATETLGRELPPPPLGACMIPIVEDYLSLIKQGMRVLDVGCGSWDVIKKHCESVGADYEGIDPQTEYFGKKTVATRIENLGELSFPENYFDLVIGNQTMEHWAENGCTLKWGLFQCFRVCKPQGRVLMNVPIHFHGTRTFMLGDLKKLERLFAPFSGQVSFYKWGYPSNPILSVYPYPRYSRLHNKPAYVLDIHAIKDRPLPKGYNNRGATSGAMAELLNYPVSFFTG
jgi:SAM-dependent methyltransferase